MSTTTIVYFIIIGMILQMIHTIKLVTSVDEIQLYTNPKYMNGSVEIIYLAKNHYEYLVNIEQNFFRDIGNVYCFLNLGARTKNETTYKTLFDLSFNVCRFLGKRNGAAFIIKFVLQILLTKEDAFMSCPTIKKGSYRLENFTFNGWDMPMAEYVLNIKEFEKYFLKLHVAYKTRVKKRYEEITNVNGFGQFLKI